jgi:hypothetical protein
MTDLSGHCLCGNAKLIAKGVMTEADACHCGMCRRQNAGGAFHAAHFKDGIELEGETVTWYAGSEHAERAFCNQCGSTLAWRLKGVPDMASASLGLFDIAPGKIQSRIFVEEAARYTDLPQDVPHKTGAQVFQEFLERQS